jgi:hypothetical protein
MRNTPLNMAIFMSWVLDKFDHTCRRTTRVSVQHLDLGNGTCRFDERRVGAICGQRVQGSATSLLICLPLPRATGGPRRAKWLDVSLARPAIEILLLLQYHQPSRSRTSDPSLTNFDHRQLRGFGSLSTRNLPRTEKRHSLCSSRSVLAKHFFLRPLFPPSAIVLPQKTTSYPRRLSDLAKKSYCRVAILNLDLKY